MMEISIEVLTYEKSENTISIYHKWRRCNLRYVFLVGEEVPIISAFQKGEQIRIESSGGLIVIEPEKKGFIPFLIGLGIG